jgi:hypothetical protein
MPHSKLEMSRDAFDYPSVLRRCKFVARTIVDRRETKLLSDQGSAICEVQRHSCLVNAPGLWSFSDAETRVLAERHCDHDLAVSACRA